jgi:hypothetical protein
MMYYVIHIDRESFRLLRIGSETNACNLQMLFFVDTLSPFSFNLAVNLLLRLY